MARTFLIFIFFIPCLARCQQTNVLYPDLYTQYVANMYLVNSAYIPSETRTDLSAYYKFQTGIFKEVSTLAFSAAKLYERDNNSTHSLRLSAFNEKQGPYISSPRAYANYGYELSLSEETKLAGGIAVGIAGMSYTGITSTGDATEYLPDASAGVILKYKTFQFGTAGLQLPNSKTKTISQMELKRYYHFHVIHELDLAYNWKWKYYALYRILPLIPDQLWAGSSLTFSDAVGFGATVRSNAGISIFAEFALDSERDRLKFIFNYNSSFFKLAPAFQNSMELGVGYLLK